MLGGWRLAQTSDLLTYLDGVKTSVLDEIRRIVPTDDPRSKLLYEIMLDYPMRGGKALRPAISIAVCRAMGGAVQSVLPTAAVLEMYHNAFLIHDDIEDQSDMRRAAPTLHKLHGIPTAINVGDGMLAATIRPLLENTERIGLGRALKILRVVSEMSRISAEGQMSELRWISDNAWDQNDRDYIRMVHKKTGWYSFIAPAMVGAIAAGASDEAAQRLGWTFVPLGIAFQIKDDLLNLASEEETYGKDLFGDLWEGKHTLILIHALRCASAAERGHALSVLAKAQPSTLEGADRQSPLEVIEAYAAKGDISTAARDALIRALENDAPGERTKDDVIFLRNLIVKSGSLEYAANIANRFARKFQIGLERFLTDLSPSVHRGFLSDIGTFTVQRTH